MQPPAVTVNEQCIAAFEELKVNKKHRYVIYALNPENTEIIVEKTSDRGASYENFLDDLPQG